MPDKPDLPIYTVFKRSCTDWRSFSRARKITIAKRVTYAQALRLCEAFNANRTPAQVRRGTKAGFTS
jgi:hypothetical protein